MKKPTQNTIGRCKNCTYWGTDYPGVCSYEGMLCLEQHPNYFGIEAWSDDDQGLEARLVTGPDFGCVLFKQKILEKQKGSLPGLS